MISQEAKTKYLNAIREGADNQAAAKAAGHTATQMRRLRNETGAHYDHDFAVAYQQAVHERSANGYTGKHVAAEGQPATHTASGYRRWTILTDHDKQVFLDLVAAGIPRGLAARQIGTSLEQIDRLAARQPDFNAAYQQALETGYPHFQERLRDENVRQAFEENNYTALRDLLIVHLPEYDKLRTSKHEHGGIGGGSIKVLTATLGDIGLPPALRDELIQALEERQAQKQLPPAVDA